MTAVSGTLEEQSAAILEIAHKMGFDDANEPTAKELATMLRKLVSRDVEELESHASNIRDEIERIAVNCLGSLTLRASKDGRREVAVTVCQSPGNEDGVRQEIVTVKRSLR